MGFDIVIGNPPYINVKRGIEESSKRSYLKAYSLAKGQFDIFTLFIEQGIALSSGVISMIVPKPLINNENYEECRRLILEKGLCGIITGSGIFVNANVESCIFISHRGETAQISEVDDKRRIINRHRIESSIFSSLPYCMFNTEITPESLPVLKQISKESIPLGKVLGILRGIEAGKKDSCITTNPTRYQLIRGQDLSQYSIVFEGYYCNYDENDESKFKPLSLYEGKKIMIRRVGNEIMCAIDSSSKMCLNTIYCAHSLDSEYSEEYLTGILNSSVIRYWFKTMFVLTDKLFPYIRKSQLDYIPIKKPSLELKVKIESIVREISKIRERDVCADITAYYSELDGYVRALYGV